MNPYFVGQILGGIAPVAVMTALASLLYRRVNQRLVAGLLSLLTGFIFSGLLLGFGTGEGGLSSRLETMLTGVGFGAYLIPTIIVGFFYLGIYIPLRYRKQ